MRAPLCLVVLGSLTLACGAPEISPGADAGGTVDASPGRDAARDADATDGGTSGDGAVDAHLEPTDTGPGDAASSTDTGIADASSPDASTTCAALAHSSATGAAVFTGTTVAASDHPRTSRCLQGGPDVTFAWTAVTEGYYRIDTFDSRYDTVLSVSSTCGGEELDCNDDGSGIRSSLVRFVAAGETLFLTVDGPFRASAGAVVVDVWPEAGPRCDAPGYSCSTTRVDWRLGYVEEGAACAAPFVEAFYELYDEADLDPGTFECGCSCGAPYGGTCSSQLDCDSGPACVPGGGVTITPFSCVDMTFAWNITESCSVTTPVPAGTPSCDASSVEVAHVAPTWAPRARACITEAVGSPCPPWSGTSCEPRVPIGEAECMFRTGARTCPAGYPQRTLYQRGAVSDSRACDTGTCDCGGAAVTECRCDASTACRAAFYTSDFCSSGSRVESSLTGGACDTFRWGSSLHSGNATLEGVTAIQSDCTATGAPVEEGTVRVQSDDQVTVCCRAED